MRWRLMSDPQFQDTDRLIEQVAPGLIDFRALPAVSLQVQQSVQTNEALRRYGLALWDALTQPHAHGVRLDGVDVRRLVAAGASPRGMAMLMRMARARAWLDGRMHVTPEDLRDPWREVMAHRIVFEPVYELRRAELAPAFLQQVLDRVPAP
jgi:MoxR-like ATPase